MNEGAEAKITPAAAVHWLSKEMAFVVAVGPMIAISRINKRNISKWILFERFLCAALDVGQSFILIMKLVISLFFIFLFGSDAIASSA
jgi:hypothetical protein